MSPARRKPVPNYLSKETDHLRKSLLESDDRIVAAYAEVHGATIAGLEKKDAVELILMTMCAKAARKPAKQERDDAIIAARKAELSEYSDELLRNFAIKRGIVPTTQTNAELIDAIVDVEY